MTDVTAAADDNDEPYPWPNHEAQRADAMAADLAAMKDLDVPEGEDPE